MSFKKIDLHLEKRTLQNVVVKNKEVKVEQKTKKQVRKKKV